MATTTTTATSWVPGVTADSGFSLANLPFGIISTAEDATPRPAVAIGTQALDLRALLSEAPSLLTRLAPALAGHEATLTHEPTLNAFAALGRPAHRAVRAALQALLRAGGEGDAARLENDTALRAKVLRPLADVRMHLPLAIGDYTDFYAGYHHAHAVGCLFRDPARALQPNYGHLPVGYHGRASSVAASGAAVRRPVGQILLENSEDPTTAPSRRLDFELELGCFVAAPNGRGEPVAVDAADDHIFGYVLLNDWSARDIQAWEYVPLGPFNGKNFATTIGAWVVLADALEPFRTRPIASPVAARQPYLCEKREESVFDIRLEVDLTTPEGDTTTITRTNARHLLWSFPQMLAHHTLGGCNLRTGDLLGSGTISGPPPPSSSSASASASTALSSTAPSECGSLLEMSHGGKADVLLAGMDVRRFLKDGDTVTLRGVAGPPGARVGFGDCTGRVYSAVVPR